VVNKTVEYVYSSLSLQSHCLCLCHCNPKQPS